MERLLATAQVVMTLDDMTQKRVFKQGGVKQELEVLVGGEEVAR